MNLKKKNGRVFMSNFVGTGPSSYEKRIYQAAVSQGLRNTALKHWTNDKGKPNYKASYSPWADHVAVSDPNLPS